MIEEEGHFRRALNPEFGNEFSSRLRSARLISVGQAKN